MHQIRVKGAKLSNYPVPVSAKQGVAIEVVVQRKRSQTSPQLQRGAGALAGHLRSGATVDAKEWKLCALSKCGKFPPNGGDPVSFMERIGEERDAQRYSQWGTLASR